METDERYEIRGKIGQGGVGAVYRAFDNHLNREVAIKRVLAGGGYENQDEATKAMLKEATSLCSVQHPHIVTVFDAGVDDDGPYVVMELLSGRTIDEMVERGTLTFADFREVALQSQEALIAAQDLDLVHRDIKPTNVMVTWLPSGRFQVKLVDFGLAKFSPKPSLQTIDHGDAVFGSIHFMAPEQFERTPLDKRTDMYSMGCVYYYCLAGAYPFDGETAPQVMAAHLQNTVTPLAEIRPDLPAWLCDWVMWHIQRNMDDRPADARESLTKFLMSEDPNQPAPNQPAPEEPAAVKRPKLLIPGAAPAPMEPSGPAPDLTSEEAPTAGVPTHTAPQPLVPPEGSRPSIHTQAQQLKATAAQPHMAVPAPEAPQAEEAAEEPQKPAAPKLMIPGVTPAPAAPPAPVEPPAEEVPVAQAIPVAQPVQAAVPVAPIPVAAPAPPVVAAEHEPLTVQLQGATPPATAPLHGSSSSPDPLGGPIEPTAPGGVALPAPQKGLSTTAKALIGSLLGVALVIALVVFIGKSGDKRDAKRLNEIVAPYQNLTGDDELPETALSKSDVSLLLNEISTPGARDKGVRPTYLVVLAKSTESDNGNISEQVAEYATQDSLNDDVRGNLFDVLALRKGEAGLAPLVEYAIQTDNSQLGKKAMVAAGKMATADNFKQLLGVVTRASDKGVKSQAVATLGEVIAKASNKEAYGSSVVAAYKSAVDEGTRFSLVRLLGAAGGKEAAAIVNEQLKSSDIAMKLAAVAALRQWPDTSMFQTLLDFAAEQDDPTLRKDSFDALTTFLIENDSIKDGERENLWTEVARVSAGEREQLKVIGALARMRNGWAAKLLDYYVSDPSAKAVDRVIDQAERAKRHLESVSKDSE
ncbi:MAG: serine/threonine protein kinase [Verrucomicrobiaceae bacterium]